MAQVFLSYAREDQARAHEIADALQAQGWSVWWDRHIPHGRDFNAYIQQELDAAECVIVLWSGASIKSQFVRDEAAEGLDGRLVPALIENVKPPLGFRQLQAADLSGWRPGLPHDEFGRLIDSVQSILHSKPADAAPSANQLHERSNVERDPDDVSDTQESRAAPSQPPAWLTMAVIAATVAVLGLVTWLNLDPARPSSSILPAARPTPTGPAAPASVPPQVGDATSNGHASPGPSAQSDDFESQVAAQVALARQEPSDPRPRVVLGNLYFDAERYRDAIPWYEAALALTPSDTDARNDLGVAYYYTEQHDKALEQFALVHVVDPKHAKAWLNSGIVKAFGKQDLDGAKEDFQRAVDLAPDSPEGQAAARALKSLHEAKSSQH